MRLLVVRHGESTNNVVMADIYGRETSRLATGEITAAEGERLWLEGRVDDPQLSEIGQREAEDFAGYFAPLFKESGTELKVYVSPFLRTLQTAQPLCDAMGVGAIVQPNIFEVGGVYTIDPSSKTRTGPGGNLSASDISQMYPKHDVSRLPSSGQWYIGGFESGQQALERIRGVAGWLRSPELQQEVGDALMVLVVHGAFINILFTELLRGQADTDGSLNEGGSTFGFAMPNTGTSLFEINGSDTKVQWLGRLDHVNQRQVKDAIKTTMQATRETAAIALAAQKSAL